jgi:hypothetical protein
MQTYYRFSGRIAHSQQTLPLPHLLLQGLLPSSNSRSLPCSLCPRSHENILWTVYTSSGVICRLYEELHGHDSRGEAPQLVLWIDEARAAKGSGVFQPTRQETGAVLRGIETQEGTRLLKTVKQGFK